MTTRPAVRIRCAACGDDEPMGPMSHGVGTFHAREARDPSARLARGRRPLSSLRRPALFAPLAAGLGPSAQTWRVRCPDVAHFCRSRRVYRLVPPRVLGYGGPPDGAPTTRDRGEATARAPEAAVERLRRRAFEHGAELSDVAAEAIEAHVSKLTDRLASNPRRGGLKRRRGRGKTAPRRRCSKVLSFYAEHAAR
jgi:hypothetical protein